jgi:hypothetical protein
MARTLQAKKQAFDLIEAHIIRRKTGDILCVCVKLCRDENDLVPRRKLADMGFGGAGSDVLEPCRHDVPFGEKYSIPPLKIH